MHHRWSFEAGSTVEIARLAVETGLWPLYEMVDGKLTEVKKIRARKPIDAYLKAQGRYKHLFKMPGGADIVQLLKELAESNIEKYGLVD
jgi:pyruvate ferredoxin oxidoreductase beta subunit